ncbi:MAG: hypothetical protein R3C19_09905 [Planctomycetaceae bacterium]
MKRILTIATVVAIGMTAGPAVRAQSDDADSAAAPSTSVGVETEQTVPSQLLPVQPVPSEPQPVPSSADDETLSIVTQDLMRPLSTVTLGKAASPAAADGTPLTPPESDVDELFGSYGQAVTWTSGDWVAYRPNRNAFPICYRPLYFEDPNLERCGQSHGCLTELTSAVHFFGRVPVLPYLMTANCPHKCVRALPDCPTCHEFGSDAYLPPLDAKATGVEAAAVVGLIFLLP